MHRFPRLRHAFQVAGFQIATGRISPKTSQYRRSRRLARLYPMAGASPRGARTARRDGMKSIKEGVYRAELDVETPEWTRGRSFPLSRLETRRDARCAARATCGWSSP